LRFPKNKEADDRCVRVFQFDRLEIVSEDEINAAIDKTYKIWVEVLAERDEEARRYAATGTGGLFGF
jgi:hypothetical protein